jgi:hypothetical protein
MTARHGLMVGAPPKTSGLAAEHRRAAKSLDKTPGAARQPGKHRRTI